jgi:hypothetical protein
MSDKQSYPDEENYSRIKVPDKDDTYLETMSGREMENEEPEKTTCSICGLNARTSQELQDHIRNAHKKASTIE